MNFNGKYKPEKYKALSEQRSNERNIRRMKGKIESQEEMIRKLPPGINEAERAKLNSELLIYKRKLRNLQAEQRKLLRENPGVLQRNYDREAYNRMISDFRAKELQKGVN